MRQFRIYLEVGNAAMETDRDVARALRDVAETLEQDPSEWVGGTRPTARVIHDANGNRVGAWSVE